MRDIDDDMSVDNLSHADKVIDDELASENRERDLSDNQDNIKPSWVLCIF